MCRNAFLLWAFSPYGCLNKVLNQAAETALLGIQTVGLNQWRTAVGMRRKARADKNYRAEMEFMVHYQLRGRNESGMTGNCSNEISPVATGHRAFGGADASHEGSGFRCGCGFMMMAHHVAMIHDTLRTITHRLFAHGFTGRCERRREHCANQSHNDRNGKCPAHLDERLNYTSQPVWESTQNLFQPQYGGCMACVPSPVTPFIWRT